MKIKIANSLNPDAIGNCLIAGPWVVSLISARPHTFVEIDRRIFYIIVLLLFLLIQEGLSSVTSETMYMEYWLAA